MPKWRVNVYYSACKTVEVEADSCVEACEDGLEMIEEPNEGDFLVEEIQCYRVWKEMEEE